MTLLSPWIFAAALAAMAVPIVVLHMLKLRRQPRRVSTTLLWRRTVEDLVANAPFQRLRWSLLLLLQLAAAAAVAAALGRPTSAGAPAIGSRAIVLIDCSASMGALVGPASATGPGRTRLDVARDEVRRLIQGKGDGVEIMLIGFALRPEALGGFERSSDVLLQSLPDLRPTDEEADLDAALALTSAFARGESKDGDEGDSLPTVVVVTDGNVRPPANGAFEVAAGAVDVRLVVSADVQASQGEREGAAGSVSPQQPRGDDNVGITALAIERRYDDPAAVSLFARLANSGSHAAEAVVTVQADGQTILRRRLEIPAAAGVVPGEASLLERFERREPALILVEQGRTDLLSSDDVAAALLPGPRRTRVLLVAPQDGPDPFLLAVLDAAVGAPRGTDADARDAGEVAVMTLEEWDGQRASSELARSSAAPDLLVFDRVRPPELPGTPSLTIGVVPPWLAPAPAAEPERGRLRRVLSWERGHPLLRHVDLDELVYSGGSGLQADAARPDLATEALALGPDGAVLMAVVDRGARHGTLGFALRQSNLPALPAFPLLIQNAIDWLAAAGAGDAARTWRPGEAIVVRALVGEERVELRSPDGEVRMMPVDPSDGRVVLPPIERSGVWTVRGAVPQDEVIPVSQLSELESNLALGGAPAISVVAPRDRRAAETRHSDLWPLAIAAALLLLSLEGLVWAIRAGRA